MTIKEILEEKHHRPWKLPAKTWRYYQEWNRVVFLHWQANYDELRKLVPEQLEIDLMEGAPWVSLVAFTMEKVRLKNLPAVKPLSDFDEINIRTYVKSNERSDRRSGRRSGVYFLSIEGGKKAACKVARAISGLPYRHSLISRTQNQYTSGNLDFGDQLEIQFSIGDETKTKTDLEKWLTERYALFQDSGDSINEFVIHHVEWPVRNIEIEKLNVSYPRFEKLISNTPDKVHYSEGVQVIAWGRNKINTGNSAT